MYILKKTLFHTWLAMVCIVTFFTFAHSAAPLEGTKPAQWRLVWLSNPASEITVGWSTKQSSSVNKVVYQKRGSSASQTISAQSNGKYSDGELYYHLAHITGLSAETEYTFRMISDGQQSPQFSFITAPTRDRPFSILFGGDSRDGRSTRRSMNKRMGQLAHAGDLSNNEADQVLALGHGGDYVHTGTKLSEWTGWMSDNESLVTPAGRIIPIIPARGNHDRGSIFAKVFGVKGPGYYTTDIGTQLRLVTLNTETTTSGGQRNWLEKQLQNARPAHRWVMAQYHRPAFPAVKTPSGAKNWIAHFEKYNVDMVAENDGHCIKRTVPIRNNAIDPTGVVYFGEGGFGAPQRSPKTDRWYLKSPGFAKKGANVMKLTFTAKTLFYKCINMGGKVIDSYQRPVRGSHPKPPTPDPLDEQAPSIPGNVKAAAQSSTSIKLTWNPSTDNVGVKNYLIFKSGSSNALATVSGTSFTHKGLSPSTTWSYVIKAQDAAGNRSAASAVASAKTLDDSNPNPPETNAGAHDLNGIRTASTTIQLSWMAPENVSVKEYRIVLGPNNKVWKRIKIVSGSTLSTTLTSANGIKDEIALLQVRAMKSDGTKMEMSEQIAVERYSANPNPEPAPEPTPTPVPEPDVPANNSGAHGLSGTRSALTIIQLSWKAPANTPVKEYRIVLGPNNKVWKRIKIVSGSTLSTTLTSTDGIKDDVALLQVRAIRKSDGSRMEMSEQIAVERFNSSGPTPTPAVEPEPSPAPPQPTPGDNDSDVLQAESATISGAKIVKDYVDYIHANNDYIEWTVNADAAGVNKIAFQYALAYGKRDMTISVNGTIVNSAFSFNATGNWSTVVLSQTQTINLKQGQNKIRLTANGQSGPNVDYMSVNR